MTVGQTPGGSDSIHAMHNNRTQTSNYAERRITCQFPTIDAFTTCESESKRYWGSMLWQRAHLAAQERWLEASLTTKQSMQPHCVHWAGTFTPAGRSLDTQTISTATIVESEGCSRCRNTTVVCRPITSKDAASSPKAVSGLAAKVPSMKWRIAKF